MLLRRMSLPTGRQRISLKRGTLPRREPYLMPRGAPHKDFQAFNLSTALALQLPFSLMSYPTQPSHGS